LAFLIYNQRQICTVPGEMTNADKIMHPQYFEADPTDIRIRLNPKIRIRIPYHFRLKFWRRRRFALSECSCYYCTMLENGYYYDFETFRTDRQFMLLNIPGGSILGRGAKFDALFISNCFVIMLLFLVWNYITEFIQLSL